VDGVPRQPVALLKLQIGEIDYSGTVGNLENHSNVHHMFIAF